MFPLSDAQEKSEIKINALNKIPKLDKLITDIEWDEFFKIVKDEHKSRFNAFYILSVFERIKASEMTYGELVDKLRRKQPAREAAKIIEASEPSFRRKRRCLGENTSANSLVVEKTPDTVPLDGMISQYGMRHVDLNPVTPTRPVCSSYPTIKSTPGGSYVRQVYSNKCATLYKPITPERPDGMINVEGVRCAEVADALPSLPLDRPGTIEFEATYKKIANRAKRRCSQNKLKGNVSCREVFEAHGVEIEPTSHGSKYHWSHLIANLFSGPQIARNLIPGTASSNYETLHNVEMFIARKLQEDRSIASIKIRAEPIYNGESFIPSAVTYHLNWVSADIDNYETFTTNPRSHQSSTSSMRRSFGLFRDLANTPVKSIQPLQNGVSLPPPLL